ncbi:putative signal peptide protein (plasmid) [Sinorhizobium sojae CCBAU 05684]|uniref:Putative signal peptide protein n=1 Tax=Sinorhizobium sojae CCBAU 05684 TaxID=716928 RepID=A0A249PKJ4_9HYPH|nr:alpha/beta hydrolase [Sinorhizobium sojae]ASY66316.1 putative signal peptide protein [Sinorhizobium sojae CCBAU 05684]
MANLNGTSPDINASTAENPSRDGTERVKNVVLVHGAFADGSGWRGVYDELTAGGYTVAIVQNPLTSFEDDVAATRRVIARQNGPVILVGHSYGGTVITEAGDDPQVAGLVYVAAFAPDLGQSTLDQYGEVPPPPNFEPDVQPDGFAYLKSETFHAGFAADTSESDGAFLRDAQVPIAMKALEAKVSKVAWKVKPSWYVVATEDGAIAPKLLRSTARRIGADTTELAGSHVVFLTQPSAVAGVIDRAAHGAAKPGSVDPSASMKAA